MLCYFKFRPVVQEILFEDISIVSSGCSGDNGTVCAILVEGFMRTFQ